MKFVQVEARERLRIQAFTPRRLAVEDAPIMLRRSRLGR